MTTLCLTGWMQRADALREIAPGDAVHFDYAAVTDMDAMFAALPKEVDMAIGWSLGAQLLVRAVEEGHVKAKRLVLLGAPAQCVSDEEFPYGMTRAELEPVRTACAASPQKALEQFLPLIALGDDYQHRVLHVIKESGHAWANGLFWLDELLSYTCLDTDFEAFPPTTIVHGLEDKVIHPENARFFAACIPGAELIRWQGCAHAPHLHDALGLRDIILNHV